MRLKVDLTNPRQAAAVIRTVATGLEPGSHVMIEEKGFALGGFFARAIHNLWDPLTGKAREQHVRLMRQALLDDTVESWEDVPPPLRAPHHTVSQAALAGPTAKRHVRPCEVNLATDGLLLLDELPNFTLATIEHLGNALRRGETYVSGSRTRRSRVYPARPRLVLSTAQPPQGCFDDQLRAWQDRVARMQRALGESEGDTLVLVPTGRASTRKLAAVRSSL